MNSPKTNSKLKLKSRTKLEQLKLEIISIFVELRRVALGSIRSEYEPNQVQTPFY